MILALILEWTGYSSRLAPDEGTYEAVGYAIAQYWDGASFAMPSRMDWAGPRAYYYANGICYYLFGDTVIPIKLLNCLIGALGARYVYDIARRLYGIAVAQSSARLAQFLPSLVLWSALNIRDAWVIVLILFVSSKSIELLQQFSARALIQLLVALAILPELRDYLFWVVALPPLAAFLIGSRSRPGRAFIVALLVGVGVILLVRYMGAGASKVTISLEALSEARQDLARGGSAFATSADVSTPGRALAYLPTGLLYFFFSPFPWQITSVLKALSLPEMLFLYYLTPVVVRGLVYTVRVRFRDAVQVLLVSSLLACCYALVEGNVGTLYRHRAQAISFFLMFAAVGRSLKDSRPGAGPGVLPSP